MPNKTEPPTPKTRVVNGADLNKLMRKYRYVCIESRYDLYTRSILPIDKRYFTKEIEQQVARYDYRYEIDDNYDHTLYIERVIRTEKQPTGGTVDTPGSDLVP